MKILIIDDSRMNQRELHEFLEERIFNTLTEKPIFSFAHNYTSTRKKLKEDVFDIVMLDGQLADDDEEQEFSYNLIPEIKQHNEKVIIVMCSSNPDWNEDGLKYGATTALDKSGNLRRPPQGKVDTLRNFFKSR